MYEKDSPCGTFLSTVPSPILRALLGFESEKKTRLVHVPQLPGYGMRPFVNDFTADLPEKNNI